MYTFDQTHIRELLPWPSLIAAIREMFISGCEAPLRHHYEIPVPGGEMGTLLLMPAWQSGRFIGVKVITIFSGNTRGILPAVSAIYVLADANTGEMLAQFDGAEITARRTAAASALAASYLARRDARRLLVIGTGRVCRNLVQAYCAIRPIEEVRVYGRNADRARQFVKDLEFLPPRFSIAVDLSSALRQADIVTSATLATEPIILGRHLPDGVHIDLIGGFRPDMREADDDTIKRAGVVFVDTRDGAFKEAGDIVVPIATGILDEHSVVADLHDLCSGRHAGRTGDADVTVFKSVGAALEDLAAAISAYQQFLKQSADKCDIH
ncbi:MAG: ornithine cyclodeaminase family protein [Stellaceae bacterium]